jgi:hypothetical protein
LMSKVPNIGFGKKIQNPYGEQFASAEGRQMGLKFNWSKEEEVVEEEEEEVFGDDEQNNAFEMFARSLLRSRQRSDDDDDDEYLISNSRQRIN